MAFSDPEKIISDLNITEGSTVADLGAGSGFYALAAARAVGAGGHVYAVDVQQDMLVRIKANANQEKLHNIEIVHGNLEMKGGTRLKDSCSDIAIVSNVLFQLEDRQIFLEELKRILKSGGRVLLVDWMEGVGGVDAHPNKLVTQPQAKELFESSGFEYVTAVNAGSHHYGLIFRKK